MTDATGNSSTNGAPKPSRSRELLSGPRAGDADVAPVIPSMADSLETEFASEGASSVAKPKTSTSTTARKASAAKTAVSGQARPAAAPKTDPAAAELSEEDSILLAGIDQAAQRTQALRDWALIRREEARDAVRTHPLGSSVIVFGAGMIFGLLMARR